MVDHGTQRFLLLRLPPRPQSPPPAGACVAPALAWIDAPAPGQALPLRFEVKGWAFRQGVGLSRVEVTPDGAVVAEAEYGLPFDVSGAFPEAADPRLPQVGFRALDDVPASQAGHRWLGLRLHGSDGSIEEWPQQAVRIVADGNHG